MSSEEIANVVGGHRLFPLRQVEALLQLPLRLPQVVPVALGLLLPIRLSCISKMPVDTATSRHREHPRHGPWGHAGYPVGVGGLTQSVHAVRQLHGQLGPPAAGPLHQLPALQRGAAALRRAVPGAQAGRQLQGVGLARGARLHQPPELAVLPRQPVHAPRQQRVLLGEAPEELLELRRPRARGWPRHLGATPGMAGRPAEPPLPGA
mmetsp:Transcript_70436/g.199742  ORF Transcript_70436/g.199742 Transcript_70436/m.199742 type:complete len:207 (+) Transcript_70436:2029-2649(+)